MKKARIVLSAVALFAVAGGALAFKAARLEADVYTTYATRLVGGQTISYCTTTNLHITQQGGGAVLSTIRTGTINANLVCGPTVQTFVTAAD